MRLVGVAAMAWILALLSVAGQSRSAYPGLLDQHPAIEYRNGQLTDVVTRLQHDVQAGTASLRFDGREGYLRSVLAALQVPIESQILVFSKTGIQNAHTSPDNPRAFYFNDRVVIGYIPGAPFIEMASHDPRQGMIFHILQQDADSIRVSRPDACIGCHRTGNTLDVPGMLVRSNFTGDDGRPMPQLGNFVIDHRSPIEQRWGGWYVTGTHGAARHMGNAFVMDMAKPEAATNADTLNRSTLSSRVDVAAYPAATSDIAALMVFDHQGYAMNLLTRFGWEARVAASEGRPDYSRGDLGAILKEIVDYFLFVDEAKLVSPIRGTSAFATTFSASGPRDHRGRSLRELDLQTRLFKYRCSYMIYSPAFDALPPDARAAVFAGMREKLRDPDTIAILDETKPGWRE